MELEIPSSAKILSLREAQIKALHTTLADCLAEFNQLKSKVIQNNIYYIKINVFYKQHMRVVLIEVVLKESVWTKKLNWKWNYAYEHIDENQTNE